MVYCSFHRKSENKLCKNYIYQKDLCFIHYCQLPKRVLFREQNNTIKIVSRYINTLPKLKSGLWKYDKKKSKKRKKKW